MISRSVQGESGMNDFNGKHVVVTGAAGVLGRAVADAFHAAHADVTGIDIVETKPTYRCIVADLCAYKAKTTLGDG